MFDRLRNRSAQSPAPGSKPSPGRTATAVRQRPPPDIYTARTPPIPSGIPVYEPEALVALHNDLLTQIRYTSGASDTEFREFYLGAVHRFASFVHALPASRAYHHATVGGMLRHGLEVAFFALRISDGTFFVPKGSSPQSTRNDEPRWRLAVFCAALCHDLGKAVADIQVTDPSRLHVWNPFTSNLVDWCDQLKIEVYHPHWTGEAVHGIHEAMAGACIDRVLTPDIRAYLSNGDRRVLTHMMLALTGSRIVSSNRIYELVNKADQESVSRDVAGGTRVVDGITIGITQPQRIIQVARRLCADPWKPNIGGGRYFYGDQGVFLVWPLAYEEIRTKIKTEGGEGVPESPETALQLLFEHGLIEPTTNDRGDQTLLWKIVPVIPEVSIHAERTCVRIRDESMVLLVAPPKIEIRVATPAAVYKSNVDPAAGVLDSLARQPHSALAGAPAHDAETALPPVVHHDAADDHHDHHPVPPPPPPPTGPMASGADNDDSFLANPPLDAPPPPPPMRSAPPAVAPSAPKAHTLPPESKSGQQQSPAEVAARLLSQAGDGGQAVIGVITDLSGQSPILNLGADLFVFNSLQVEIRAEALATTLGLGVQQLSEMFKAANLIDVPPTVAKLCTFTVPRDGKKSVQVFRFDEATTRKMRAICPPLDAFVRQCQNAAKPKSTPQLPPETATAAPAPAAASTLPPAPQSVSTPRPERTADPQLPAQARANQMGAALFATIPNPLPEPLRLIDGCICGPFEALLTLCLTTVAKGRRRNQVQRTLETLATPVSAEDAIQLGFSDPNVAIFRISPEKKS